MKKEYIKPKIIIIKTCNDEAQERLSVDKTTSPNQIS